MKLTFLFFISAFLFFTPKFSQADEGFIQWHSTNVQLLRGWDYEVGSEKRTIATFEHVNAWTYGDFFMFMDYSWPDIGNSSYYTELSPRLSLSKITGEDLSYGIIKDALISTTVEKPDGKKYRYLYGGALDLALPEFSFFTVNAYIRDDTALNGQTWQTTLAWSRPFKIANTSWVMEGFADFSGREANSHANQLIVPRMLMDLGALADIGEGSLWVGIEWQYWHNKFGIQGKTESAPQLQIKWVL